MVRQKLAARFAREFKAFKWDSAGFALTSAAGESLDNAATVAALDLEVIAGWSV